MALVLPSTVQELNRLQHHFELSSSNRNVVYKDFANKGFENIEVEKRYKREVSLPNGVANWNISNFDSYLNFEENMEGLKANDNAEDRLVPEDSNNSFCCPTTMDDRRMLFPQHGVKTFNTICVDSGSTCISTEDAAFRGLDVEETYQNLDLFLQQVPEMTVTENLPSPLSSNDSNFELPCLPGNFSLHSQDTLLESGSSLKRPASTSSEDDFFGLGSSKHFCNPYSEGGRKKNSVASASKNCRKTRKEKQKEMEIRVSELEKEKEGLRVEVQVLEELIQAHKTQLYAILQKR